MGYMTVINEKIDYCLSQEISGSRSKFPKNKYKLAALVEEVGELAQALIDHSRSETTTEHVFKEAIQVAAMALRIAEEGSAEFPYKYNDSCYREFKPTSNSR